MKNTILTSIITTIATLLLVYFPLAAIPIIWVGAGLFFIFWTAYNNSKEFYREPKALSFCFLCFGPITYWISSEIKSFGWPKDLNWLPKFQSPIVLARKEVDKEDISEETPLKTQSYYWRAFNCKTIC